MPRKSPTAPAGLERQIQALRDYYARHGAIPSLSILARLWGYGAKSWAAVVVARLRREGVLETAPGRRLRPGPRFPAPPAAPEARAPAPGRSRQRRADPIERAADSWASEVTDQAAEAYALTMRIVTVAALIEQGFRDEVQPLGLGAGEVLVLDALRRLGPPYESTPARLKEDFMISFAGIGKRLERLQRLGYAESRHNPHDRRSRVVRLTPAGLALLRDGFRGRYAAHVLALMALPPADRAHLADVLQRVQRHIEAGPARG
jgi:DNA-binding MarR family transcriptional regulator